MSLETVRQYVREKLRPIDDRIRGMVVRGVIKVLDEAGGLQRAQVALGADDLAEGVEIITPPGFTSRPAAAEVLVFAVQGAAGHRVGFAFDRTTRLKGDLANGEAAMFVGRAGQLVKLLADGGVEIRATGGAATTASSVLLKANGDVVITPGTAGELLLGDAAATKRVALAEDVTARLDALKSALSGWTPVAMDGGAALKTALASWLAGSNAVGADNVKAKG